MGNVQPLFQGITDRNEFFLESVKEHRTLTGNEEQIKDTLSGHLFNAKTGIERGLVDGVGTFQDALQGIQDAVKSNQTKHFYLNNNSNIMEKSILQRIIGGLQSKFRVKVNEEASAEDVAKAIEEAQSIEDLQAQIVQEVTAELQKTGNNQAEIQQIKDALAVQEAHITALNTAKTNLEQKVAELTGNAVNATQGNANSAAPNITQFKTGMDFNQRFLKPELKES
jgi:DNA repair exonuclease SbcCD ATPase subunit